jgi:lipopolysaccharide export LptBFGC system permease protein LptF
MKEETIKATKRELELNVSVIREIKIERKLIETAEEAKNFGGSNNNDFSKIDLTETIFTNEDKINNKNNEKLNKIEIEKEEKTRANIEEVSIKENKCESAEEIKKEKQDKIIEEKQESVNFEVKKEYIITESHEEFKVISDKTYKENASDRKSEDDQSDKQKIISLNKNENQIKLNKEEDKKVRSYFYKRFYLFLFFSSGFYFSYYLLRNHPFIYKAFEKFNYFRFRKSYQK